MIVEGRAALKEKILAEWTVTPICWPNEAFDFPVDDNGSPRPWLYCEIIGTSGVSSEYGSTGKRVAQDSGLVAGQVYYPTTAGDDEAYDIAQQFGELLRVQKIGPVQTEGPSVGGNAQGSDDGKWWRVSVSIPFTISYFA